ncbi:uncharacterized protein [Diadema setosum]|uniref:uncharacterized protein n=1 Tax=Diadema setosum TaxID=31175 RepID=UPI003B3B2896
MEETLSDFEVDGESDGEIKRVKTKPRRWRKPSGTKFVPKQWPKKENFPIDTRDSRVTYYLEPEFLHDIARERTAQDNDSSSETADKRQLETIDVVDEPVDGMHQWPRKKSPARLSSNTKPSSKRKPTFSRQLLEFSDDISTSDSAGDSFFRQCVCSLPWRCHQSHSSSVMQDGIPRSAKSQGRMDSTRRTRHQATRGSVVKDDELNGWFPAKSWWDAGVNDASAASSVRESKKKKAYDPFMFHRNEGDSVAYTFKHYHDWQAYVDEYRRYYTVGGSGTGLNSFPVPEGGGRQEAMVIVRTLSDSLRPRLKECNIPDWDEFTDLHSTPMRPLHVGPGYKSGRVPDVGVTWLSGGHQDSSLQSRYPATRHIKLTTLRHPAETMASQSKKRQLATNDGDIRTVKVVEAIPPHDGGVTFPVTPMQIVEDFRMSQRDKYGADMRPFGCRFLASWRPSDSTNFTASQSGLKHFRTVLDTHSIASESGIPHRGSLLKQGPFQPLVVRAPPNSINDQSQDGTPKLLAPSGGLSDQSNQAEVAGNQRRKRTTLRSKKVDVSASAVEKVRSSLADSSLNSAASKVDASKWTNLSSDETKTGTASPSRHMTLRAGLRKKSATRHTSDGRSSENGHGEKPPSTPFRTCIRSSTARSRTDVTGQSTSHSQPGEPFLVKGENKRDRSTDGQVDKEKGRDVDVEGREGVREKSGVPASKPKIKIVAPCAQPLDKDNVLVGSPYGTNSFFGNEQLDTRV